MRLHVHYLSAILRDHLCEASHMWLKPLSLGQHRTRPDHSADFADTGGGSLADDSGDQAATGQRGPGQGVTYQRDIQLTVA